MLLRCMVVVWFITRLARAPQHRVKDRRFLLLTILAEEQTKKHETLSVQLDYFLPLMFGSLGYVLVFRRVSIGVKEDAFE